MGRINMIIAALLAMHITVFCDRLAADTIYKYIGQDGSVVFKDNPPPGAGAKPFQTVRHVIRADKQVQDKQKAESIETESRQQERAGRIQAAREEYEKAQRDLEKYHLNKNQSGDPYLWWQWNKRIEAQNKEIDARRQRLEAIERAP